MGHYAELTPDEKRIWSDLNRPPYDDLRKNNIANPEPGTLAWLAASKSTPNDQALQAWPWGSSESTLCPKDFAAWRDSPRSGSLLVRAPPGQGKSVLSNFVIGHLQDFLPKSKIIYYFCSIGYPQHLQNAQALLRALIVQLSEDRRVFHQLPPSFVKDAGNFAKATLPDLWIIFQKALREGPFEKVYCVVDGLDVYGDRMENLHVRLKTLFNPEHPEGEPLLKLFCTSRDQENIDSAFKGSLIRRCLPDDEDLSVFIMERSSNLRKLSNEQRVLVQRKLKERAGKTFLWLDVVIRSLQELTFPSHSKIEMAIDRASTLLPDLYRLRVNELSKDATNRRILVWVVYAQRPLNLGELADAVAFGSNDDINRYSDCKNDLPHLTTDGLRNSLGALLDIVNEGVYLIHQSLKDFFEESKSLLPGPDAGPEPRLEVAMTCMRYLALDDLRSKNGGIAGRGPSLVCTPDTQFAISTKTECNQRPTLFLMRKYPLFHYAANHWFLHIEAPNEVPGVKLLPKVLRSSWLNIALNLPNRSAYFRSCLWRPCDIAIELDINWLAEMILNKDEQVWTSAEDSFKDKCLRSARQDSTRVLRVLLTHKTTEHLQVTEGVLNEAARRGKAGKDGALSLFLEHRPENVKVDESVLQHAAANELMDQETLDLCICRAANTQITEGILVSAAGNPKGKEVIQFLLSRDPNIQTTERILEAAAENTGGKEVLQFLLDRDPNIQITERILIAATRRSKGEKIVQFLLDRNPNFQVTLVSLKLRQETAPRETRYCRSFSTTTPISRLPSGSLKLRQKLLPRERGIAVPSQPRPQHPDHRARP